MRSGDSGGPVYDEYGRVIGIVQFSFESGVSGIAPMKGICESKMLSVRCDFIPPAPGVSPGAVPSQDGAGTS